MKKILLLAALTLSFMSCEQNELIEAQPEQILGESQMYRNENLESIIDQWTGTNWTTIDKWFKTIRNDSQIILEFNEDGTFNDRYADVVVAKGVWKKVDENNYYYDYIQESNNINDQLVQRRFITFYCDNTYSVKIEGNDRAIYYYKKTGVTECGELIEYKVTD